MKNTYLYLKLLSIVLLLAPLLSSCDSSPESENKDPDKALVETVEEAEGVDAAKGALDKKKEEEEKENQERKTKKEEKAAATEASKAPQGMMKRK